MSQRRTLTEAYTAGSPDEPALRVDAEAGVIHGVKVLGRFSRNSHGVAAARNGTEYTLDAIRKAIPLYEGADVMTDHPARGEAGNRSVRDVFGKLRNVRLEGDDLRADLHYLRADPMASKVVEDVTRRLGVYGLSHNAAAGTERIDRHAGRLVIESIDLVRSVDLVRKPATNRNLWESTVADDTKPTPTPKTITFREVLESQGKRWSKGRKLWADRLLEMDDMSAAVAAPVAVEADVEPDDALWSGFESAIMAVLGKYESEELDAAGALAKIKELLTTHEKLDADDEPDEPSDGTDAADEDKTESVKPDADAIELAKLRREKAVRELCESLEYQPTKPQLTALVALESKADRTALIEELKAAPAKAGVRAPRSGRVLKESAADGKADADAVVNRLARLRGGF